MDSSGAPHVTIHRLRFNDTDRLGHVNNAVFAVMLEQGRTEFAVQCGLPIESDTTALVIVRLELDFVREMIWPGDVRIETQVSRIGNRSFTLRQQLLENGAVCARGLTVLVIMDRAMHKAIDLTPDHRAALTPWIPTD